MLDNKIVLVTGGTGFLGSAVVRAYLRAGAHVWVNFRDEKKFEQLRSTVGDDTHLHGVPADLAQENSVKALFAEIISRAGHLHILAHVAGGFWMGGELGDTPLEKFHHMLQMNLLTTFLVTREAFSLMKNQQQGVIFTVASKTAEEFPAGMGAYSISKAAVIALTRTLANEGKAYNIRANTILPGIIDTPANRAAMPNADTRAWVTPEQIAAVMVQLSSETTTISGSLLKMYGKL